MPLEVSGEKPALSPAERERQFEASLRALEDRIGYTFKNPKLLEQAMTAPDYARLYPERSVSNKVLEHAGDKLLHNVIVQWVKQTYPNLDGSQYYFLDHILISNTYFSVIAMRLKLNECVRVSRERQQNTESNFAMLQQRMTSDALEALCAALYQDGGRKALLTFVHQHMLSPKDSFLADLIALSGTHSATIQAAFRKLTHGRGELATRRMKNGEYLGTVRFDGKELPELTDPRPDKASKDALRFVALRFFTKRPWVFWRFDGPASVVMPRAADEATVYGAPLTNQAMILNRTAGGKNGGSWLSVVPMDGEGSSLKLDEWKPIVLPRPRAESDSSHGHHLDQLRYELVQHNQTLTVRAPVHNPKGAQQYAFYANNELILIIREAKSLNDAANKALFAYRENNGN